MNFDDWSDSVVTCTCNISLIFKFETDPATVEFKFELANWKSL